MAAAFGAASAMAAPMGFKDSTMLMLELGRDDREVAFNHAFTPRDALGATLLMSRSEQHERWQRIHLLSYTRLVKRWNMPEAQANAWFFAGLGEGQGHGFEGRRTVATPGFQVDYETTRVYAALSGRWYGASDWQKRVWALRSGFSFAEVDYDEVQPWIIVELKRSSEGSRLFAPSDDTSITPMLRLIHKRYFLELGIEENRQARINLMLNF